MLLVVVQHLLQLSLPLTVLKKKAMCKQVSQLYDVHLKNQYARLLQMQVTKVQSLLINSNQQKKVLASMLQLVNGLK